MFDVITKAVQLLRFPLWMRTVRLSGAICLVSLGSSLRLIAFPAVLVVGLVLVLVQGRVLALVLVQELALAALALVLVQALRLLVRLTMVLC